MSALIPISLAFFLHAPFSDNNHGPGNPSGVFWHFINASFEVCPTHNFSVSSEQFENEDHVLKDALYRYNVSFPITENPLLLLDKEYTFIPLITSPGAVWLDSESSAHQNNNLPQLRVIIQAWPLLVIILFSCSFAGIIVWILERLKNPQEFPRPFVRGFWEGVWWAFVSMTTVGYGDRSPKTVMGRFFAVGWICFGLVVISIFTATITTALSQGNQPPDSNKFFLFNITVLNGSYERIMVYEMGGKAIVADNIDSIIKDLTVADDVAFTKKNASLLPEPEVDHNGALLEHYMYLHIRTEHSAALKGLLPKFIIKRPTRRGLYTNIKGEMLTCMIRYFQSRQIEIYDTIITHNHEDTDAPPLETSEQLAKNLFSTDNIYLIIMSTTFIIIFLLLFIWERCYWRPRNPDYKYIVKNWKSERQKKESEFKSNLDFKNFYKYRKSSISMTAGNTPIVQQMPFPGNPHHLEESGMHTIREQMELPLTMTNGIANSGMRRSPSVPLGGISSAQLLLPGSSKK